MKLKLRTKLTASYLFITFVCVALISLTTNFLFDKQFQQYVQQNQEQRNREIVNSVTKQISPDAMWNSENIENIGVTALENSLIIKVKSADGTVIWDAKVHNHGLCEKIIQQMAQTMKSRYPNLKGGYLEKTYPIIYNGLEVGFVDIGSYDPFYYSVNDLIFINTLNNILMSIGVFSLFLAFLIGTYMASRLTKPISRVINSTQMISRGFFDSRIEEKSTTKEIHQLMESINNLADTLSNQELLRKRITADMAHELRTPLATLQSHLEAMLDGIWEMNSQRLEGCHEEILRINRMVSDLEKLARIESENLILTKEKLDLSALIKRITQNFENEFSNKGIKVAFEGGPVYVYADKDKISQIIVNLISNAVKYTNEGGFININVHMVEERIMLSVKDNGIGIADQDLPYIFERLYRADKSRNKQTGGSGIGLAIVKSIVQAHHGQIEVKSELGKGTEFILYLPVTCKKSIGG